MDNSFGIGYGNQYGKSVPLLPFIDFAACTIKVMTKQQSLYWYIKWHFTLSIISVFAVFQYEPLLYFGKPAGTIHIRVPAKRYAKCQTNFRYNLKFWIGTTVTPNVTLMPFKLPYKYTFIRKLFSLNRLWQSIKAINIKHFTSKHIFFKPRACPLYRHYLVWGA